MEISGTIKVVGQVNTFGSGGFKKREVVITTNEQYPQVICLEVTQDKADKFNGKVGDAITADINIRGREWTNPQGEIKYFTSVECWKWELGGAIPPPPVPKAQAPKAAPVAAEADYDDEMPF